MSERTYASWSEMMKRCNNPQHPKYPDYGGRGITVCEDWKWWHRFLEDMGERPEGRTLNRLDNEGNYNKTNCNWATPTEQARNKRNYKNNKSGVKGVSWQASCSMWKVKHNGKYLGIFADFDQAVAVRRKAEDGIR